MVHYTKQDEFEFNFNCVICLSEKDSLQPLMFQRMGRIDHYETVFARKDESMISFRGDAHKIYLQLKNASNKGQSYKQMPAIVEIEEIKQFYHSIDSSTLKLIFYRMIKEKNGSGIVPIFVSSIPWFLFMFSNKIQDFLFKDGRFIWLIIFAFLYFFILITSVILHFREKAWAAAHIEIIQDVLKKRNDSDIA